MRHPRKAHVKVIRNGKKLPPVVVARSLRIRGQGMVHTGPSYFCTDEVRCDKSVTGLYLDNSTWDVRPGARSLGMTGWDAANQRFV